MLSREETYQLKYTIALIAEFAKKFHLGKKQAYNYIKRFNGFDYLKSFYDVLHTLSFEEAVRDISIIYLRTQWWQAQTSRQMIAMQCHHVITMMWYMAQLQMTA